MPKEQSWGHLEPGREAAQVFRLVHSGRQAKGEEVLEGRAGFQSFALSPR